MKATGIVRRIDDLGRIVIPKEIRRTLRIREGDPLEIFTDQNGAIVLKVFSNRRSEYVCGAICTGTCGGIRKSGLRDGSGSYHCGSWKWEKEL